MKSNIDMVNMLFAISLSLFLGEYYEYEWKIFIAIFLYPLALLQYLFVSTFIIKLFNVNYHPGIVYIILSMITGLLSFFLLIFNEESKSSFFFYESLALSIISFFYIALTNEENHHENVLDANGAIV